MERALRLAALAVIVVAAILPAGVAAWPPLYDYHHWVFQGHILASLASLGHGVKSNEPVSDLFSVRTRPVPNLAAAVGMAALDLVLEPATGGRVFLALTALVFGLGFATLTRSIQRRPSALEVVGFAWAYGYFAYAGYLSYLFALGVAFAAIAWVVRMAADERAAGATEIAGFAVLAVMVWFSHLFGWIVLVTACGMWMIAWARSGQWRRAIALAVALLPSAGLFGWYAAASWRVITDPSVGRSNSYGSGSDKVVSLVESLLLFVRTDPLPPLASPFWSNLFAVALLGAAVTLVTGGPREGRRPGPLQATAALLALLAIALPFGTLGGMGRPDERLTLPALMLALASLTARRASPRLTLIAATPVLLVLAFHAVEYRAASRRIGDVLAQIRLSIPADEPFMAVTLWDGRLNGGCDAQPGLPSIGLPALKWVALNRAIETGRLRSRVMGSALLRNEFHYRKLQDTVVYIMKTEEVTDRLGTTLDPSFDPVYPYIALLGCDRSQRIAELALTRRYQQVARSAWCTVLSHR